MTKKGKYEKIVKTGTMKTINRIKGSIANSLNRLYLRISRRIPLAKESAIITVN